MSIRFATPKEIANWNTLVLANPDGGHILQSFEQGEQKKQGNWLPLHLIIDNYAVLVLEKHVPLLGKIWYVGKGPGVQTTDQLALLLPVISKFAKTRGVFVVKLEPEILKTDNDEAKLAQLGLLKVRPIQPNHATVILDVGRPLETILTGLPQKGRHALRRAERDGVKTSLVDATDANCRLMFDLMVETSGGRFPIRDYPYYHSFWQRFATAGIGQFLFAQYDDKMVAGAYVMVYGKKGTYKDGASIRDRTAYGASHLLQWRAIEFIKKHGVTSYDLCGTPPASEVHNKSHPYYGIGLFKTSLNKQITEFVGTYDLVIKPSSYKLWLRGAERLTNIYYVRVLRQFFY